MFENVLVGVDGMPGGRDAITLATQLIDPRGTLTLAHVHRGELTEELEDVRELLERERAEAAVQAELVDVVAATPGRGLHQRAEQRGADLLVVGSSHRGAFGRVMLGDDTRLALNGAPCAVAIAPRGYREHPARIERVGVAYNASPESVAALATARELAARGGAKTCAMEVVSIPSTAYAGIVMPSFADYIEQILAEAAGRLKRLPDVEGRAVYGLAGEELAAFGDQVDVLVVGSRGYGPVRRLVLGSTSAYLQRHARCPLVVLPRVAGSGETTIADATAGDGVQADAGLAPHAAV